MDIKLAFSTFATGDLAKTKEFYEQTLGLSVDEDKNMGLLTLNLPDGLKVTVYPKEPHVPAEFTVLNFVVDDIDAAVDELASKGIEFEKYEGFNQDDKGIARSDDPSQGPSIAWFKDPDGNVLSILEDSPLRD